MEPLLTHKNIRFADSLVRIGDIVNFEGPLLSLFEDVKNGHLYLFDWVDRVDNANRWLIYQVHPKKILNFIQKKISYNELFTNPVKNIYYFTDIKANAILSNSYLISRLDELPHKYYPNENDFFNELDCPNYDKIMNFLINKNRENLYQPGAAILSSINHYKTITGSKEFKNYFTLLNEYKVIEAGKYNNEFQIAANAKLSVSGRTKSRYKSKRYA